MNGYFIIDVVLVSLGCFWAIPAEKDGKSNLGNSYTHLTFPQRGNELKFQKQLLLLGPQTNSQKAKIGPKSGNRHSMF